MRYIDLVHPNVDRDTLIGLLSSLLGEEFSQTMLTFDEILFQRFEAEVAERIYERGVEKGIEKGIEKGRNKALEEAREGQRALLLRQLGRRFGALPEAVTERVARASAGELDRWCERIIDVTSLDDLFAEP